MDWDGNTLTVLLVLIAFASGIAVQRWLLKRSNTARAQAADREAQTLLSDAQERARINREKLDQAKSALQEKRKAFEAEQKGFQRRVQKDRGNLSASGEYPTQQDKKTE